MGGLMPDPEDAQKYENSADNLANSTHGPRLFLWTGKGDPEG